MTPSRLALYLSAQADVGPRRPSVPALTPPEVEETKVPTIPCPPPDAAVEADPEFTSFSESWLDEDECGFLDESTLTEED